MPQFLCACSVRFQTTVSAFMASYILVALLLMSSGALGILTLRHRMTCGCRCFMCRRPLVRMPTIDILQRLVDAYGASTVFVDCCVFICIGTLADYVDLLFGVQSGFSVRASVCYSGEPSDEDVSCAGPFFVALNERTTPRC